jgi:hypothetical protein
MSIQISSELIKCQIFKRTWDLDLGTWDLGPDFEEVKEGEILQIF